MSVLTLLVILSFPSYFLYLPFQDGFSLFAFLGFTALLGWISLVVLPPIFFANPVWGTGKKVVFIAAVSLYTLSTVGVKWVSLFTIGTFYADYLVIYPVLIFIEWLLPIFYIYVAVRQPNGKI
jgi:hypothetical protein